GVAVTVERGSAPDEVRIRVSDTGIGIAPAEQARIFHEFEQGESTAARKVAGTGLGLAICRRIVERMGGAIAVDSRPGAGATFTATVTLPAAPVLSGRRAVAPPPDLAGRAALIVAPTAISASLIARQLQQWGAATCIVPDETIA